MTCDLFRACRGRHGFLHGGGRTVESAFMEIRYLFPQRVAVRDPLSHEPDKLRRRDKSRLECHGDASSE
jgi:hypothetical protein